MKLPLLITAVSLAASSPILGQDSTIKSNGKGLDIVRQSLQTHGGIASTDSLKIKFRVTNQNNITPGQSYAADAPFDSFASEYAFEIDKKSRKETGWRKVPIAGFEFESTQFVVDGKSTLYSSETKTFTNANTPLLYASAFLPQLTLSNILKAPFAVRYYGEVTRNKRSLYSIVGVRGTDLVNLLIDKSTGLLFEASQLLAGFGASGDGERKIEFSDYVKAGPVQMPTKVKITTTTHVLGSVVNTFLVTDIEHQFGIDPSKFHIPDDYLQQDFSYRKPVNVRAIGDGLYVIENVAPEAADIAPGYPFSYNVVFAEFEDHVLVVESPWDEKATQRVIDIVKKTIANKPIKYLVQTHHHDDHIGGIRGYVAERSIILTSPSNAGLIGRIADAPLQAYPDRLELSKLKPVIEPVAGQRVLKDGRNEALILDIGPNTHSKENLVVYFPKQKVLYQADMVNDGEHQLTKTSQEFIAKLKALNLQVDMIVGTHGRTLEKDKVEKLLTSTSPKMVKLSGDPSKEGLHCFRLHIPAGTRFAPHSHPLDQFVTVLTGKLAIGYGESFNLSQTETIQAGNFLVIPAGTVHYEHFTEETTVQIHGPGPLQTNMIKK